MLGRRLNSKAQELKINVLLYFEREEENGDFLLPLTTVYERVNEWLGVFRQTTCVIRRKKLHISFPLPLLLPFRTCSKPNTRDPQEITKMEV